MTLSIRLLACIFLSLILYGEQGYVTLALCAHNIPQHQQDSAGVRDSHAEADPLGEFPIVPCHDGMVCSCHISAVITHQPSLSFSLPSADAVFTPSVTFADDHPLKVFRPPLS